MEITSVNNELVKKVVRLQQKKYRDESKLFLLEGFKCIEEAFNSGIELKYVFVNKKYLNEYHFIQDKLIETNEAVLKKISTTDSIPEAVGIGIQSEISLKVLETAKKVAVFENIKDSGNLGTILRSASAFGIDAVVLLGDTVDLYNPKCVRASVGNLWKTPVVKIKNIDEFKEKLVNHIKIATLPRGKNVQELNKISSLNAQIAIMFGSEANGISEELLALADSSVTIEMKPNSVESLNLSISAGIIFYKLFLL